MAFDANDPADQKILEEAVTAAVAKLDKKNKELQSELRKAKQGAEIDPADVERLERELETATNQLAEANKQLKTVSKQAEDAAKALEGEKGYTSKLLVENGLNAALLESGVKNPAHVKAAAALIRTSGQIEIAAEGETRVAKINGKPLADFVKEWAGSDDGKAFVSAPNNAGGGAPGGQQGGAGTPPVGNLGGTPAERVAAINARFNFSK